MSKSSTKKKVQKRVKDAMRRSETVHRKASGLPVGGMKGFSAAPGIEDEESYFNRTGNLFPADVNKNTIFLEKPPRDSEDGPKVVCTCGEFEFGPSTNLMKLGLEGKKHAQETGHQLRSHNG